MKQRLFFLIASTLLILNISSNAFSLDLGKELDRVAQKVTGDSNSDITKSIKGVGDIDQKINKAIEEATKSVTDRIQGEIDEVKSKIEEEEAKVKEIIKEAENGINKFSAIKDKAEKYVKMAKMFIALLSTGMIAIAFFLWRVWKNIVGFKKLIKNVTNYDAIKEQIEALENKVAELEGRKVAQEVKTDDKVTATPTPMAKEESKPAPKPEDELDIEEPIEDALDIEEPKKEEPKPTE